MARRADPEPVVETVTQACEVCGRLCQHGPDGKPQPHYEPRPGRRRCVASPVRPRANAHLTS